jgi:predicted CXXCH cytochrome family protein
MANALVTGGRVILGLAGALLALAVQAGGSNFVIPGSQAAKEQRCVEPTDFMRRNHMEVIKHQRDATVHGGIRSTKHSLAGCIDCHVARDAQGQVLPVNDEKQFCGACHDFAAVRLNCFDCHATVPTPAPGKAAGSAGQALGGVSPGSSLPPGHPQPAAR